MLHTAGVFVEDYENININSWKIANFIDSFVRFCVPVFLMITGAVLLDKDESMSFFLRKRYKRILIPFIFWNCIYLVIKILLLPKHINVDFLLIYNAFIRGSSHHFWYIYMILGVYLFIPIIRKWTISAHKNEVIFFLLIWTITLFIPSYFSEYFIDIELIYFSKYLGYIVLGFFIDKFVLNKTKIVLVGFLIYFIAGLTIYWLTYFFSEKSGNFFSMFYEYLTPNVAVMSIGIFIFFKFLNIKSNSISYLFDKFSYGIYLVHVLVLKFLLLLTYSLVILNSPISVGLYIFIIGITTYLLSFIVIYILTRIKILESVVV